MDLLLEIDKGRSPFVMPSVMVQEKGSIDYVIFPHEIEYRDLFL